MPRRHAFPLPGRGSLAVLRRQFLAWRKAAVTTMLGDLLDPLIMLLALGYGLGGLLPPLQGVSYITYIAGGLACMSALWAATFECTFSTYSRLRVQRIWDALLNTPLDLDEILWAELAWGTLKALKSGVFILLVVVALDISRQPHLLLAPAVLALAGLAFTALALCFTAVARSYDFFIYYFTLLVTPMVFLSGVFFPIGQLPGWLATAVSLLPLVPTVELVRPLLLGQWPAHAGLWLAQLALTAAVATWLMAVLMRRRLLR